MSDSLIFDMQGDPKGAEAAFKRVQKELEKTKQAFNALASDAAQSERQSVSWAEKGLTGIASMAAGALSLQTALRLVNAEYQQMLDRQQKAADTVISTANAKMSFQRNLGDVSQGERDWWDQQVSAIASRTGQLASNVYVAAGKAKSSQGNLTDEQLARNIELGFRVAPESPAEASTLIGGLGDLASLTGSGDARVNLGLMLAAGKQARVESLGMVNQNLVPGAIGVKGYGGTEGEAMALTTTLTNLSKDTTGAATKTAAIAFAEQADKILGEKGSPLEHIRAMQANPALAKKFLEKATFEKAYTIPIRDLITGGSEADKLLTANLSQYGDKSAMGAAADRWLGAQGVDPLQQVARLNRTLGAKEAEIQVGDLGAAKRGAIRDKLLGTLGATGQGRFWNQWSAIDFDVSTLLEGDDPVETAIKMAHGRAQTLRRRRVKEDVTSQAATPQDEAAAQKLDTLIAELRGLRADQKQEGITKKNINRNAE